MIHICQGLSVADNRVATMLEDRKKLFIDLLGWEVEIINDRFEIDQYDGKDALYLIATDDNGDHIGSMRLLATKGSHLLADQFAALCDDELPRGSAVTEITRLCLPQRLGAGGRLWIRNRLISAMVDHALGSGISVLTGVVTASYRAQILRMGWRCAPLGPERMINGAALGAFRLEIDADTPALLAANGIYAPGCGGPVERLCEPDPVSDSAAVNSTMFASRPTCPALA